MTLCHFGENLVARIVMFIGIVSALIGVGFGALVGVLAFQEMSTVVEVIIAFVGISLVVMCLALICNSVSIGLLDGKVRKLLNRNSPGLRKNHKDTMPDALKEYSHSTGVEGGAGEAIRQLATEQLKYLGYLKR